MPSIGDPNRSHRSAASLPLTTRRHIAYWAGETGDVTQARRLFEELLTDQQRVLGPDHPDTLITRSNIAYWTVRAGDVTEARRPFDRLLTDQERVLGPNHPHAINTPHALRTYRANRIQGG